MGERTIASTGEIKPVYAFKELPYYGRALQRHGPLPKTSRATTKSATARLPTHGAHRPEPGARWSNALIRRYGRPAEVVVELARDLKQNRAKAGGAKKQADNQRRNARIRERVAETLGIGTERVRASDIQKWILWEELSFDVADRRCPTAVCRSAPPCC